MTSLVPQADTLPQPFRWLNDAPLFIDEEQVSRFYDAVVRPSGTLSEATIHVTKEAVDTLTGTVGLSAEIGPSKLAALLGALVDAKLTAKGEIQVEASDKQQEGHTVVYRSIDTPQRQLIQLTAHYAALAPERLFMPPTAADAEWRRPEIVGGVPRGLVFLEFPGLEQSRQRDMPATKIIPTAAEFQDGAIELIYAALLAENGERPPKYPEEAESQAKLTEERRRYWAWFEKSFSATRAMIEVEKAASKHGRISWIDYRIPLTAEGESIHLHVQARGKYDTGTFAYNFIKRGYKHGLRIVATLKAEPDINVLAIYER